MNSLFPNRSRRDLKLKFKKEERTNGYLITKALIEHATFDIEELTDTLKKEDDAKELAKEQERLEMEEAKKRTAEKRA